MSRHDQTVATTVGYTTWIWFAISSITVLFFLLASINSETEFNSVIVFSLVTISSFMIIIVLMIISKQGKGHDNVRLFFMQEITLRKTLYIPAGLGGVFTISLLTINSNVQEASFISILGAGLVMGFCFLRTHTIIVPILIHGIYNSIVVVLRDQFTNSFLSSSPISVPEIEVSLGNASNLAYQVLFQNFLVASSEEMFKILIMAFFVVTLRNRFVGTGGTIVIGMLVSTVVWSAFHYIQAL